MTAAPAGAQGTPQAKPRRMSESSLKAERLTYFVGFVFLMAFLVWVTWFDIIRGGAT